MNKIFDLHNDFITSINNNRKIQQYLKNKKTSFANEIISTVWTSEMKPEKAIQCIETTYMFINKYKKNKNVFVPNLRLGIEDLNFLSKNYLNQIINLKPTYCSLTWNYDNNLAGGAHEGGDLTNFGKDVIRSLEDNNIFVDTAHLSERSFMSFSKLTEKPILCSHTAVNQLVPVSRNLKDYQIRMIVESDGLIGVALVPQFLSNDKKCTVNDVCRHIDYIVSRFGDKNICLGTDFYGTKKLPKGIKTYKHLQIVEDRLKILGYTNETINNIFYQNAKRFFN